MIFSVITPTHFRPEQLRRLLVSLEQQTLPLEQFEVILVPSPNDLTLKNLPSTKFQLQILSADNDPFGGTSASYKRNAGARAAKGLWLAFIDDDCVADKNWLLHAHKRLQASDCQAIEGLTQIPKPEKMTYTYKGLQRLSKAGGYQTCNMFYKKSVFLECEGFDLNFPFYLEDTDLAWTLLDRGHKIVFDETCVVEHPVPAADVNRLLFNAYRARLLPYLYKKHPHLFKNQGWKVLQRFQWAFLAAHTMLLFWFFSAPTVHRFFVVIGIVLALSAIYTAKQLRGCSFSVSEALKMLVYYVVTPWITFFQLWRGNLQQKTFVWR
jgi:GT2 family glycosyltransferase